MVDARSPKCVAESRRGGVQRESVMGIRRIVKKVLVHSPLRYSERMDGLLRLTLLKSWIGRYSPHPHFAARDGLFAHVAETAVGDVPISFFEFGVYKGASLDAWTRLNSSAESEFVGFDSFEGLPEAWLNIRKTVPAGSFTTGGELPAFGDRRVRLVKGWFRETLPLFLRQFSPRNPLVVHCDADIYTSTLFVLVTLDSVMRPGTVVMFDDFTAMLHDFRAWDDYTRAFGRRFEVLGAAGRYYENVAVRLMG